MTSTKGIKRKFSSIQMVVLVVGEGKIEILVHENVLSEASPVFKTNFTSKFEESSERSIYLPDDDAGLMDVLIQNLYAPQSGFKQVNSRMELLRLYVLADKFDIIQVKNGVCSRMLDLISPHFPPSESEVKFVYDNTTPEKPIRKLMIDWFIWTSDPTWYSKEENRSWLMSFPEFAVAVCRSLANALGKTRYHFDPRSHSNNSYREEEPANDTANIKSET